MANGRIDPAVASYVAIGQAWRADQPAEFNRLVRSIAPRLDREIPDLMRKSDVESLFNSSQPFYTSSVLYVIAFLVAVFSWLRWPGALGRTAFWLTTLAWLLSTAGIVARMWIEGGRPSPTSTPRRSSSAGARWPCASCSR
jgi:hypothetical protein